MSSVETVGDILKRLRLNKKDLRNLSVNDIQGIFLDLNIQEIFKLCRTSRRFNSVCNLESLWKSKVIESYGVNKALSGKTWKFTAKIFYQNDMINLGKRWINGMRYLELLEESLDRGNNSLVYLNHLKNSYIDEILERNDSFTDVFIAETQDNVDIICGGLNIEDENLESEEYSKIKHVFTKELGVIAATIAARYYSYPNLPGTANEDVKMSKELYEATYIEDSYKNTDEMSMFIDSMYDYMHYVVNYSSFNGDQLQEIISIY